MVNMDSAVSGVLAAQQSALHSKIAASLMAKQLDVTKAQGEAVVQLIDAAANLGKEVGKGTSFDRRA